MRVTNEQYKRIIGLVGRGNSSSRPEPEVVCQRLATAARAARKGCFQEAENLVASLPVDGPLGPATLDLKARIFAQQGRLIEAQFCWMEAVRRCPGNESYRRSLDYVTRVLRPPRFPLILYIAIMALLVLAAAIFIGTCSGGQWPTKPVSSTPPPAATSKN